MANKDEDVIYHLISDAVCAGKLEKVKELINSFELSDWPGRGDWLLCEAIKNGHAAIAKLILRSRCKVIYESRQPVTTALHFAVINGDIEIVKMILDKGANIDTKNEYSNTPLHTAIENKKMEITQLLLKHGAEVNAKGHYGTSPLHVAVKVECLHIAPNRKDRTLLHNAIENKKMAFTDLLLKHGANVNAKDKHGTSPLHVAVKVECLHAVSNQVTELLLKCGADVNSKDQDGRSPLHIAVKRECIKLVKVLLQHNADINASDKYGRTALHVTALYESDDCSRCRTNEDPDPYKAEIAKLLLSKGADINSHGESTLYLAIHNGYKEVVKVLLECGAKVDSKIESGFMPLHFAAQKGCQEIMETILKFGADINCEDGCGRTALHIASYEGHTEVVATLLEYGSDINITSRNNRTALDEAMAGIRSFYDKLNYLPEQNYDFDDDDDDDDVNVCPGEQTADTLERHIIKMQSANLYVSEKNLQSFSSSRLSSSYEILSDLESECKKERAHMKSEKINNAIISFDDILTKGTSSLAKYMRNENIVHVLKSDDYKTKFPIYASMIGNNFRKGMERKELLEQGSKIFHFLLSNFSELPHGCSEKIFNYLSNKDLRKLIDASKPFSISTPNDPAE